MAKLSRSFTLRQLAILCGLLLILGSLITPNNLIQRLPGIDILGFGDGLGVGQANAQGDLGPSTIGQVTCPPVSYTDNGTHYLLNNNVFIYAFDKDGYSDIICSLEGIPLIDATFCQLEILATRRDIEGTPSVEEIDAYHYRVTRTFVANILTYSATLKIIWDIYACDDGKLTIDFQNGSRAIGQNVKIRWYNSVLATEYEQTDTRVTFKAHKDIGLDWSDVEGYNVSNELSDLANGTASEIVITVGTIDANEHVVIDPSTVGNAGLYAVNNSYQRQTFYGASRYWVFYASDNSLAYSSSLNGENWTAKSIADTLTWHFNTSEYFSLHFDGTYVHLAYATGETYTPLYYKRGHPNDDGTITWNTTQEALPNTEFCYYFPSITTDSAGHPIIAYENDGELSDWEVWPFVTMSDNTDGTWATSDGFPYVLSDNATGPQEWGIIAVPRGDGFMVIYGEDSDPIRSRIYDGASWGTENFTTSWKGIYYNAQSAVTTSDHVVHLTFTDNASDIRYTHYHADGNAWETEEVIYAGTTATVAPVLSKTLDDNLYCFWMGDNETDHIYYKSQVSGVWDTDPTDWLTESDIAGNDRISCAYSQTTCNYIPVIWMTGTSPYYVRFAAVERSLTSGLAGCQTRQLVYIAAAVPTEITMPPVTVTLSTDTRIASNAATTNYGSDTYIATSPSSTALVRSPLTCNLTATLDELPSGYTILSATLYAYYYNYPFTDPSGNTISVKELTQIWTEAGATWNTYDGSNNWPGGVGALGDTTGSAATDTVPASYGWMDWDITSIVLDAADSHNEQVNLLMYDAGASTTKIARYYSKDNATNKPYISLVYKYTPTVLDDKIHVNVYKGSKTVEDGTWTVASENYNHRLAFDIQTFSALTENTYPMRIVIDTETLVAGGFTSDNWEWGKRLEWADSAGSNTMKYWATEETVAGVTSIKNWNTQTPGTVFYITPSENLSANTTYTRYLYIDPDIDNDSGNYGGSGMVGTNGFFEHFVTAADNLTDFLDKYDGTPLNDWDEDPIGGAPTVVVDNSTLVLTGVDSAWEGISSNFTMQNFRALFGWQSKPGSNVAVGMFDVGGIAASDNRDGVACRNAGAAADWQNYLGSGNTSTSWDFDLWATDGTFITEIIKYGDEYRYIVIRDDPSSTNYPDSWRYHNDTYFHNEPVADVPHKVIVASYLTGAIVLDWIVVALEVEGPPVVIFPDITYNQIGTVFCDDQFSSSDEWYNELAFADSTRETELYWCIDRLAQLTRQPGESIKVTVKLNEAITSNTTVYVYYDNPNASGTPAYCSCDDVFGTDAEPYRWQAFSDNTDWSGTSGNWSTDNIAMPLVSVGPVGNIGGGAGRLWMRFPNIIKWDTNDYYMVCSVSMWELGNSYWPAPFSGYVAHSDTLGEEFDIGYSLNPIALDGIPGWNPICARVETTDGTKTLYSSWMGTDGFHLVYTTDPSDPDSWVVNSNGPFLTSDWWADADSDNFSNCERSMSGNIYKNGATWYAFMTGQLNAIDAHKAAYAYTTDDPEDWDSESFTYGGVLLTAPGYIEDDDIIYDATSDNFYWAMTDLTSPSIRYYVFDNTTDGPFPGTAGDWGAQQTFDLALPVHIIGIEIRSPRYIEDDSGDWWLFYSGQSLQESGGSYPEKWICDLVVAAKCTTDPTGTWVNQNLDSWYKQSDSSGLKVAYVTNSDEQDGMLQSEVIIGGTGQRQVGLMFRYDNTTNNGYYCSVDYNSGDPKVKLQKVTGGSLSAISGAADYDIPQFLVPWISPGYRCQLRLTYYGPTIETYLSLWGNEWVLCHSVNLTGNFYMSGQYGLATNNSQGYFNNYWFADYVDAPPYVSSTGQTDTLAIEVSPGSLTGSWAYEEGAGAGTQYLRADTWYTTEALSGDPSSGTPLFTLSNTGTYTVDVSISSSANWTGVGKTWTVSPIGTAGDSTIGIWAGLDSDTSYPTLVKPDAPANLLIIGLGSGEHDHFGLLFYTPTSNIGQATMSGTITLTAMVHT